MQMIYNYSDYKLHVTAALGDGELSRDGKFVFSVNATSFYLVPDAQLREGCAFLYLDMNSLDSDSLRKMLERVGVNFLKGGHIRIIVSRVFCNGDVIF